MLDIESLLGSLSEQDQSILFDALAYKRSRTANVAFTRDEQALYDCLTRALGDQEQRTRSLAVFLETYGIARYRYAVQRMRDYLDHSCGEVMRMPKRVMLTERVLGALVAFLRNRNIPASHVSVLNAMVMVSDAVDAQFPGYAQANLLHRIVLTA